MASRHGGGFFSNILSRIRAFHVRHQPFCQGTRVRPSRRFPSSPSNPAGTFVAGTSDRLKIERSSNKIIDLVVAVRSSSAHLIRQAMCASGAHYCAHGPVCASQRSSSRRNQPVKRMVSSHIRRPHDETGRAKIQSLL